MIAGLIVVSLMKLTVAMVPVAVIAYLMFDFNLLSLGLAFAAFFANLVMMSWALGLISIGAVLRWGMGAESIAWLIVFLLLPVSCVYYPVSTLPPVLQSIALCLPSTYVFEGLRALVLEQTFRGDFMLKAFGLNLVLMGVCYGMFTLLLAEARRKGSLVQMGE